MLEITIILPNGRRTISHTQSSCLSDLTSIIPSLAPDEPPFFRIIHQGQIVSNPSVPIATLTPHTFHVAFSPRQHVHTTPPPPSITSRGFERLGDLGFNQSDIASLRAQFQALGSSTGPEAEDAWIDNQASQPQVLALS
jgi:hypothetical protein